MRMMISAQPKTSLAKPRGSENSGDMLPTTTNPFRKVPFPHIAAVPRCSPGTEF